MRAVVISEPGVVEVVETEAPRPAPGEVLVRSHASGICGSDVELYRGDRPAEYARYPVVPGHEWSGTVAAVGQGVATVEEGDKVVVEGILHCDACDSCREGLTNLCERGYDELGFTRPGGLSELVAAPARQVHRLPPHAPLDEAALLEPTAVVADAFLRAPVRPGSTVAIIGDGAIGLLAVELARLHSPAAIVLIGSRRDRLELGLRVGATHAVSYREEDPERAVRDASGGRGADLVFEGAGRASAVEMALRLARRGGAVALQGIAGGEARLDVSPDLFALAHLTVLGTFGANARAWTHAVQLFSAGLLDLAPLITHRLPVTEYQGALDMLVSKQAGALKVLLMHQE